MASKGPTPKRSDARHGHRTKAEKASVSRAPGGPAVAWPEPDADWHPLAREFFVSLGESGQRAFYEPSDVALAKYLAESMSRNLLAPAGKFSSMLFSAVWTATGDLLASEGSRRRLRIELEKADTSADVAAAARVSHLADARKRMESRQA